MNATVDRRMFVKGSAAAAGAMAIAGLGAANGLAVAVEAVKTADTPEGQWAFEIPPAPIADDQITETYQGAVVVVGSGVSGLVCGARAAEELGDKLILVSAGTLPVSRGGSNHGIGTKTLKNEGIDYTAESCSGFIKGQLAMNSYAVDMKKWSRWINTSAEAMDWVCDLMESKGYKTTLEEGYVDPDGIFTMPTSSHGWIGEDVDDASLSGETLLVNTLRDYILECGGQIFWGHKAEQLVREDDNTGRVSAVVCSNPDGNYVRFEAERGIVLATGDFSLDRDMVRKYCPNVEPLLTFAEPNYDGGMFGGIMPGDGQKMGLWVGAAWQRIQPNAPMVQSCHGTDEGPSDCFMMAFTGLMLDEKGERFMSEDVTKPFLAHSLMFRKHPGYWAIWNEDYVYLHDEWYPGFLGGHAVETDSAIVIAKEDPELQLTHWNESVEAGYFQKADTIEELLEKIEHPNPEAALESIKRYNEMCANGLDEDFHKNPEMLVSLENGPYFGVNYQMDYRNFLTIMGGLRTNEKLQVCEEDDTPIEGLYNIGTMVGDMYANMYTFLCCGQNLGATCITFGYDVAKDLCQA